MGAHDDKQDDLAAFTPDPLEDLTIQDALIISAVYVVKADPGKCKRISTLAQKNPLFVEEPENTLARVNKFTNLMQNGKFPKALEAVTRDLKPEQRKQAFEFAIEASLAGRAPTEKKKQTLQTLADQLALGAEFVDRKLANI